MDFRIKLLLAVAGAACAANGAGAWPQLQSSAAPGQQMVSRGAAEQLALDRSPQGSIKKQSLEQRPSGPTWVIDVGRYNQPQYVTRVEIDATTGKVSSGQPAFAFG